MKTLSIILIFGLVFSIFTGTVYADNYTDKFYGEVEIMPERGYAGLWTINGRTVQVGNNTVIEEKHGRASAGAFAEVKGQQSGDIFTAYEIEIKQGKDFKKSVYPGKFYGTVEKLPERGWQGVWIINGREILVTGHTEIEEKYGRIAVGALVKVEGNYSGNRFTAYEIEVKGVKKHRGDMPRQDKSLNSGLESMTGKGYEGVTRYRNDKPGRDRSYNSRFSGVIESMPQEAYEGLWVVDGRNVEVNNKTSIDEIDGKASVGAYAKIKGIRKGKSFTAYVIEIISKQK